MPKDINELALELVALAKGLVEANSDHGGMDWQRDNEVSRTLAWAYRQAVVAEWNASKVRMNEREMAVADNLFLKEHEAKDRDSICFNPGQPAPIWKVQGREAVCLEYMLRDAKPLWVHYIMPARDAIEAVEGNKT